jgi:hypothetical protein
MLDQTIAIVGGTGPQGRGLAYRFAHAGHRVLIGSRSVERAQRAASELRARLPKRCSITGLANAEAATLCDIAVLAVPYDPSGAALTELAEPLAGKTVTSCVNPLGFDKHGPYGLDVPEGSAAEQAQTLLPDSVVIAGFHHLSAPSLLDADYDLAGEDVLLCGDDEQALTTVSELGSAVTGHRSVIVGPLRQAGLLEAFTAVIIATNQRYKTRAGLFLTQVKP